MNDTMFTLKEEQSGADYSEFVIEPLETGFGHTLGNALRRVLLTSIPGASVTSVKIEGAKHRFSTVPGLKENIVDLLLNVKMLSFSLAESKPKAVVKLSVKGPKEITAADLELPDGVEIANKDQYIGSLADRKSKLEMEFVVEQGYGYSLSEERKAESLEYIPTDAIFTPVKRVNYDVEATRVGRQTNLDKLVLRVWTNGTVTPKAAVEKASNILATYFFQIYQPQASLPTSDTASATASIPDDTLKTTIDELDLPTRIYNSLRNGGIETVGQLLQTPRKELMSMRNMGGKSLGVIEEKLKEKGISFNL